MQVGDIYTQGEQDYILMYIKDTDEGVSYTLQHAYNANRIDCSEEELQDYTFVRHEKDYEDSSVTKIFLELSYQEHLLNKYEEQLKEIQQKYAMQSIIVNDLRHRWYNIQEEG